MRRSCFGLIVFLLAMAVQAIAPMAVSAAKARGRGDVICLSAAGGEALDRQKPANERRDHQLCVFCVAGCDGDLTCVAAVAAHGASIASLLLIQRAHAGAPPASWRLHPGQPRAPPASQFRV